MNRPARARYDSLSRWYDLLAGSSEQKLAARALALLAVQPGEQALEIGPGTGHGLAALCRAAGRVAGVDVSAGMLRHARKAAPAAALCQGDALDLPFAEARFDVLMMAFTLELFAEDEISLVLAECRRVLKPGGRLGAVVMAAREASRWAPRLYRWARQSFPQWVDCRPIQACAVLAAAGFLVSQAIETAVWGLPVDILLAKK